MTDILDMFAEDEPTNAVDTKTINVDDKYDLLTEREKILIRPSRYVGAIEPCTHEQWILKDDSMKRMETTWNPAFLKLFDEVIANSTDHARTSEGSHMSKVAIDLDIKNGQISVFDNGGIPVVRHSVHKQYIPELIFGNMHAGSNFRDDEKSDRTGQNGEGSTLVNIMSSKFVVETADGVNSFIQTFSSNMSHKTTPVIKPSKKRFTRITWTVDKSVMKCSLMDYHNYNKVVRRIYDAAGCNPNLKFYINGELIKLGKGFIDYINLFDDESITASNDDWQLGFSRSLRGDFEHISFVNGTASPQGGTHIDYIMDQVIDRIREHVKKKTKQDVLPGQIKNHFLLFVNARVYNPRYDSQTKENLVTNVSDYGTTFKVPESVIKKLIKSPIMESIMKWVEARALAEDTKKLVDEQKKAGKRDVEKHIEAAGEEPLKKYIHFTEGDSAIGNFVDSRNVDFHGGYPLRGKVLNVREKSPVDIIANTECADIMSIVGLTLGEKLDPSKLKYGHCVIMTDADPDGDCITGQLLNFFALWPELFEQKRILRLRTPMYIISRKGDDDAWIYNRSDYNEYCKTYGYPDKKNVKYIKGLGELTEDAYHKCINNPVYQVFSLDDVDKCALELAFGKDAKPRKPWLLGVTDENKG